MARKSRKPSANPALMAEKKQSLLYRTGIYVRLSVEDNGGDAKDSIQNQTEYLKEYIDREHGDLQLMRIYADNGTSGTSFDRDGWNRLMEDIKSGDIPCEHCKRLLRQRHFQKSRTGEENHAEKRGVYGWHLSIWVQEIPGG